MHAIAVELHRETEVLNALYAEVAKRLAVYGIEASIPMVGTTSLEFRKHGDTWRLMVLRDGSDQPLLSSSRRVRVEAAAFIAQLFDQIVRNASVEVERTTQAQITLRVFLERTKE